jgi:hypothetical protein
MAATVCGCTKRTALVEGDGQAVPLGLTGSGGCGIATRQPPAVPMATIPETPGTTTESLLRHFVTFRLTDPAFGGSVSPYPSTAQLLTLRLPFDTFRETDVHRASSVQFRRA